MMTFEQKKDLIKRGLAEGRTMQSIADEIGVTRQYIHALAHQIGAEIKRPKPRGQPSAYKVKRAQDAKDIAERRFDKNARKQKAISLVRDHGYSYDRAAKAVGLTGVTIKTACQKAGVISPQSTDSVELRKKEAIRLLKKGGKIVDVTSFTGLTQTIVSKLAYALAYSHTQKKGEK